MKRLKVGIEVMELLDQKGSFKKGDVMFEKRPEWSEAILVN